MALAYTSIHQPGLFSHHYPPPLLPKPGKDNIRLQKLLKRSAKKKAAVQVSQSAAPFRSSLSPVNEASPDLEHSDHSSTPPKTPETLYSFYSHQPPRFSVKPVKPYQHVASPYPQRAAFGRGAQLSPQTVGAPLYTQHVADTPSYPSVPPATQPAPQPPAPKITLPSSSALEQAAVEVRKPAFITLPATPRAPSPGFYSTVLGETRPLTVLTPIVKSKSPFPNFKANERSRSPKPMFDVPQIRNYTASTSYYETSRTPPVYDTAGLTFIGGTLAQSKTEIKRDSTPSSEITAPTADLMDPDQQRTPVMTGVVASTQESQVQTPASASEVKRATPVAEIKRATPTSEPKCTTPNTEITVKTTTNEYQSSRTSLRRPRTPAYRPTTPAFEVSRPNPLLFAVSPITVEQERSITPKSTISDISVKSSEVVPNGDLHLAELPEVKPVQALIVKSKSESDIFTVEAPTPVAETLSTEQLPSLPSQSIQRPKTPTFEASRLMSSAPGLKRPKTPTYGPSLTRASPVGFQRPKTPTQVAQKFQKSSYRGLTPAEYAAYGGIKTYSPAFGITTSLTAQEDIKVEEKIEATTTSEKVSVKEEAIVEVPKPNESTKELDKPKTIPSIPTIVVTQASETIATTTMQKKVSSQIVEKASVIQETKVAPQTEHKKPSKSVVKPIQEPAKVSPEVKQPIKDDQDGLKAVRKLFGKAPPAEQKAKVEQKQETKPQAISETKSEEKKLAPFKTAAAETKMNEKKEESTPAAPTEKKEEGGALQAEPLLKALQKPKGLKSKKSGWSRLKKHMVVEQEEPQFPDMGVHKESTVSDTSGKAKPVEAVAEKEPPSESQATDRDSPKATQMWNAVLFQMFSTKENIMAQIEMNKSEEEKVQEKKEESAEIPSFAHRLPVLLFSPRFDAKKLREAASRPVTKISTVFEMGLIGRKGKEEEPKDFNRTARGFAAS
ncbi:uncharacterized protein prr33 [Eucyclogobius newberryi]|uniref:uncharacterized protein prr33 n=1 Tax=Eucyclogobius newberryi TaxID=166745 RepID=UPI003B59670F